MTTRTASRYDTTLRAVMWLDAFLSLWMVYVCIAAVPVVATVGVPAALRPALMVVVLASAILLAGFGAITGVVLMLRMRAGNYLLPEDLRLPLPRYMRPSLRTSRRRRDPALPRTPAAEAMSAR